MTGMLNKPWRIVIATGLTLLGVASCTAGTAAPPTLVATAVVDATAPPPTATAEPATLTATASPAPSATASDVPPTVTAAPEPSVAASDQSVAAGTVTVTEVVSPGAAWLAIRRDEDGQPGIAIGYAALSPGDNENVVVTIDPALATATLYAAIHTDDGVIGDFEFPYYDPPLELDGAPVLAAFAATGLVAATETPVTATEAPPTATEAPPTATAASLPRLSVAIEDFKFAPVALTVPVGTTVVWTHVGTARHTVTADDGSFDSGTLSGGGVFEFTFTTPGTYAYHCRLHGNTGGEGMSGVITVTSDS